MEMETKESNFRILNSYSERETSLLVKKTLITRINNE